MLQLRTLHHVAAVAGPFVNGCDKSALVNRSSQHASHVLDEHRLCQNIVVRASDNTSTPLFAYAYIATTYNARS